jgi:hypothetical protein
MYLPDDPESPEAAPSICLGSDVWLIAHIQKHLGASRHAHDKPRPQSSALPLVQTFAPLRAFHSAPLHCKGGETPQLALATPGLRQEAFGI